MKPSNATSLSRRAALQKTSALGVAAVTGSLWSTAARAQASTNLETRAAKLGFIALTDAAPLFVADEKGYFKKHGMTDVEVLKQSSWGTTRDNLVLGSGKGGIDGAHILTPMPYLISTGAMTANNIPTPMTCFPIDEISLKHFSTCCMTSLVNLNSNSIPSSTLESDSFAFFKCFAIASPTK